MSNLDRCHHCDEQYCDAIDSDDEPVHKSCDPRADRVLAARAALPDPVEGERDAAEETGDGE